jgi:NAD(P)-dependent dehydrogenase (short-subunit alcohol dehydrogenase family)
MTAIDFSGRVVVITGAGGGIGRAHAELMAQRGASVVVNDVGRDVHGEGPTGSAAQAVVEAIRAAGGEATASADSIATAEGGAALIQAALDAYGRVDAIVHNAGILRDRSIAKLTAEDVDAVMAVHLLGAFNVLRPAYPVMRDQGYGRVVLTSSASGLFGNFGQANYGAAKAGLIGLMNVLAVEGARHGILANAISPTALTRMTEGLIEEGGEHFVPEHVAPIVAFLASERCSLTHHIFTVGGGRVGRIFLGVTPGVYFGQEPTTPEEIERRLGSILSLEDFIVPATGEDEVALIMDAVSGGPSALVEE